MRDYLWAAIGLFVVGFIIFLLARVGWRKLKRAALMRRFGDTEMVQVIMEGRIAQGMSAEMVIAAWGEPADMDERVMKTKTKREMKFDQTGKNRFSTRVYLENGEVVGWETK
jgi:hypothetical protein